jgi:uncharacterized membrane protein YfcA
MFTFEFLVVLVAFFAGMTASVTGFGIGSFLIPLVGVLCYRKEYKVITL